MERFRHLIPFLVVPLLIAGTGATLKDFHRTATLDVDGKVTAVSYWGHQKANDLLKEEKVDLTNALIVPKYEKTSTEDMTITVRYRKPVEVVKDGEVVADEAMHVASYEEALSAANIVMPRDAWTSFKDEGAIIPRSGTKVVISTEKVIPVTVAGEERLVVSNAPTVADVLDEAAIVPGPADELNEPLSAYVKASMKLKLVEVKEKTSSRERVKGVEEKIKEDPELPEGATEVANEGSAAVVKETVVTTYADGKARSTEVTASKVVKKGAPRIVLKGTLPLDPKSSQALAFKAMKAYGWGGKEFTCLVDLWNRESGWRHTAENRSSGAYGIPQSLPGSKMASAGKDWRTNPATQIKWGLGYIDGRYGSPCKAWAHSERVGWY